MQNIRVTKRFRFEMAHSLHNYDGLCKHIHGHSYNLDVTLIGKPKNERDAIKDGMVIDFGDLKDIVKKKIVNHLDHSYMISSFYSNERIERLKKTTERLIVVDFQPTAENIVVYIAEIVKKHLPEEVQLFKVGLSETATSYAEWYASDNQ